MAIAAMLGVGWVLALALLRRLDGTPIPGFASGFPSRFTRSLARVAWQSLVLAGVSLSVNALDLLSSWRGSWMVVFSTVTVLGLGTVRCVQIMRPLAACTSGITRVLR